MRTKGAYSKILKNIKPVAGVYKITNSITKEVYIGQSSNIKRRIWNERCDSYSHLSCPRLKKAMKVYGKDNFIYEILEEIEDKKTRLERESYYINFYDSIKNGYNINK